MAIITSKSWRVDSVVTIVALLLATTRLAAQSTLQITSPADGTPVSPGQVVAIVVAPAPGSSFPSGIAILGDVPLGGVGPIVDAPFSFSLTVPTDITPGKYAITAVGRDGAERLVMSAPIGLVVERSAPPVSLSVQPPRTTLRAIGQRVPLSVIGMFADGTTDILTHSTKTSYTSGTPAVATVDSDGVVTAAGRGTAVIAVRYAAETINVQVSVVTGPAVTVSVSPSRLWPPNGKMVSVTVSGVIADTGGGIRAMSARYAVTDAYGTIQPAGLVTLGPNGAYSFIVSLEASRRGDDGGGRQYAIVVTARDNSGNPGSGSAIVLVPHDQGR